ncbi:MAG TPA: hypothetical protein VH165_09770 [Kofleriaceae bacterium]|nr:hypothetical protein [Kofleriaceae bacterium]
MAGRVGLAAADAIPTIKIDDHGPDQSFPTNSSFYVQGDAGKNTTSVQVAIVRISSSAIYYTAPSCTAVAKSVAADKPREDPLDPGVVAVTAEFPNAVGEIREQKVVLSSLWTPTSGAADPNFKVLISNDSKFISAGVSYCLFILKRTQQIDDSSIRKMFDKVDKSFEACEATGPPAKATAKCGIYDSAMRDFKETVAKELPSGAIPSQCPPLAPADDAARKYCALFDRTSQASDDADKTVSKRNEFKTCIAGPLAVLPTWQLSGTWIKTSSNLGHAIGIALARHGVLVEAPVVQVARQPGRPPPPCPVAAGATFEYRTRDLATRVQQLQVLDDERIQVADCEVQHPQIVHDERGADLKAADLLVADGVSLHDIILLGRGQVAVGVQTLAFGDIAALLDKLKFSIALEAADAAKFDLLMAKFWSLMVLMNPPALADPETLGNATAEIHAWLVVKPGVTIADYHAAFDSFNQAYSGWKAFDAEKTQLEFSTGEIVTLGGPKATELKLGLIEQSWVFTYFAPFIGYAFIGRGGDDSASYTYTGIQFHLYANPANDPLWSHGFSEDWNRAWAIELGFGLKNSNFGTDSRYSGALGLVPINVSLALHIIPYTSISLGVGLVDRRESVLPSDNGRISPTFLIGFNVVPNVIDLAKTYGTNPTVEKKQ